MKNKKPIAKPPLADIELIDTEEAASVTKLSMAWFERARWEKKGPPYYRAGRSIRYVKSELIAWMMTDRVGL